MSRSSHRRRFVPSLESMPLRLTPSSGATGVVIGTIHPADTPINPGGTGLVSNGTGTLTNQNPNGSP